MAETAHEVDTPRRSSSLVRLRRMGIDTDQTPVVYMRRDCAVCRAEGFEAQSRIEIHKGSRHVVATLNVVHAQWLANDEAGLSEAAWHLLQAKEGETAELVHPEPLESLSALRAKVYGHRLDEAAITSIIQDIVQGHYSEMEIAAFVTACIGDRFDLDETVALTRAMVSVGERLHWDRPLVVDKHCTGGLPGNRTTLIVVPIVAACGLTIPKTSSRAITSPAGTADTMEVLAPVDLDLARMRRVVEREGGCRALGITVRTFVPGAVPGDGLARATQTLDSGAAWAKFQAICKTQGGLREPPVSRLQHDVVSPRAGTIRSVDNRRLSKLAKLAGAPHAPAAGLELHTGLDRRVEAGEPLFTLHADTTGELAYALDYLANHPEPLQVEG